MDLRQSSDITTKSENRRFPVWVVKKIMDKSIEKLKRENTGLAEMDHCKKLYDNLALAINKELSLRGKDSIKSNTLFTNYYYRKINKYKKNLNYLIGCETQILRKLSFYGFSEIIPELNENLLNDSPIGIILNPPSYNRGSMVEIDFSKVDYGPFKEEFECVLSDYSKVFVADESKNETGLMYERWAKGICEYYKECLEKYWANPNRPSAMPRLSLNPRTQTSIVIQYFLNKYNLPPLKIVLTPYDKCKKHITSFINSGCEVFIDNTDRIKNIIEADGDSPEEKNNKLRTVILDISNNPNGIDLSTSSKDDHLEFNFYNDLCEQVLTEGTPKAVFIPFGCRGKLLNSLLVSNSNSVNIFCGSHDLDFQKSQYADVLEKLKDNGVADIPEEQKIMLFDTELFLNFVSQTLSKLEKTDKFTQQKIKCMYVAKKVFEFNHILADEKALCAMAMFVHHAIYLNHDNKFFNPFIDRINIVNSGIMRPIIKKSKLVEVQVDKKVMSVLNSKEELSNSEVSTIA